jgi:DNA-binding beta-propeller fold protein YncE
MYYLKGSFLLRYSFALLAITNAICTTSRAQSSVVRDNSYHSSYDDKTLTVDNSSVLMPYNRFIDPAGTVIRFGDQSLENHSLDCSLFPNGKILAVEDRYGLALIDVLDKKLLFHVDYDGKYKELMSTYSGIKVYEIDNSIHIFWGATDPKAKSSFIVEAIWDGKKAAIRKTIPFKGIEPSPMALPNDITINNEGGENYLYVVLNGNSQLTKLRLSDQKEIWTTSTGMAPFGVALTATKAYVSNWAGPVPTDVSKETAGIPYGSVYIDPRTGATASGTVSIIDLQSGKLLSEIEVGLHPNAIISSKDQKFIYVANGNSDNISVISTLSDKVIETFSVKLRGEENVYIGDSPNALAIDKSGTTLYVSNGMDNAVAVVSLGEKSSTSGKGKTMVDGFIPTEAYPAGLALTENTLYVANLEGEGARVETKKGFTIHQQEATVSIISIPDKNTLSSYTSRVESSNMVFRTKLTQRLPRKDIAPKPVPERIGEPSVFKHVVYIIKENKTYDQVLGDMREGDGMSSLCIYGNEVTPNQHKLAKDFLLLDNYYASGKCSGEGHSWTDAAIVTDYIEKNVRANFRSYAHVLADALVYNKEGFIWNNALDHGKTVRVYGEACKPVWKGKPGWEEMYQSYLDGKPAEFVNETTISRIRPILSPIYPGFDGPRSPDQLRSDAFIKELNQFDKLPGDQLPQLMVLALPADHTSGTKEGFPTPRAMVADNDLALGKIIEALTKSKFWNSTVVFVTEDDSQSGWDHVSAYRTTGFVISPYSHLQKTVHTNYNQTCIVRTIEQILGIPPMNVNDVSALPMFDCFNTVSNLSTYGTLKNEIPLNEMNRSTASLKGKAKKYALLSATPQFDNIDGGNDDLLNHILWYAAKGNTSYPKQMTIPKKDRTDEDD